MERVDQYRQAIRSLLEQYAAAGERDAQLEIQVICDREHDHYQLVSLGWQGQRRFYSCLMHLDIKNGKVWIQRNQTDQLIAQELIEMGVAREDIVLGLQPAYARSDTGYGVA